MLNLRGMSSENCVRSNVCYVTLLVKYKLSRANLVQVRYNGTATLYVLTCVVVYVHLLV